MERLVLLRDKRVRILMGALLGSSAFSAFAAVTNYVETPAEAQIAVSATVASSCVFGTIANSVWSAIPATSAVLNFTGYNPAASSATATSTSLQVTCTSGTATLGIDYGIYGNGISTSTGATSSTTPTSRAMTLNGNTLFYEVYQATNASACPNSTTTTNQKWGPTGTAALKINAAGLTTVPVCGVIPPQQEAVPGTYLDTLTATLTPAS